ncbi:vWA domain-containing protein [Pseudonocardia acaciae]|uniref:vWA domain-containing protein n=1 Tax=Pseudonocardia acaciae TaxID=551276 RepID=UPI0004915C8E|nr:VWA domain-containing protein [Pseudonocardia acaciae]
MTEAPSFAVEVDLNPYLAADATDVDAIVTITAEGGARPGTDCLEILIIDCSTSMTGSRIAAARHATSVAIGELRDGVSFAVIAGNQDAEQVFPPGGGTAVATEATRTEASAAVQGLTPSGGTAIGRWLTMAGTIADAHPDAIRHAILLTDGKNEHETEAELRAALARVEGRFACDCRGVGTDWRVDELRTIASALLGSVDIVADPDDLAADFGAVMNAAMGKAVADIALRLWTPRDATVRFVKQVAPTVEDLTARRHRLDPLRGQYPLGSWGAESRDYHLGIRVEPGAVRDEKLAARVQVVQADSDEVLATGKAVVTWTNDSALSTRINRAVASYTGQAELADAIQQGLAARKDGDERTATARLGRAVALAEQSGNTDTARLLGRVVEVVDAPTGTVRLRKTVSAEDEMTLDTRSTKTVRVRPKA